MDVLEAIKARRSIRKYQAAAVADNLVEQVLEAARWAPSWANTQCWCFVVVRDKNIKSRLAEAMGTNPATEAVLTAPVVIVACAEMGRSGFKQGQPSTDKGDWFMYDVALAMQNLALAAHALGLGTVHVGRFDAVKVGEVLGVPPGFRVVAMTPLGYPVETGKAPARKELAEFIFHDRFGLK